MQSRLSKTAKQSAKRNSVLRKLAKIEKLTKTGSLEEAKSLQTRLTRGTSSHRKVLADIAKHDSQHSAAASAIMTEATKQAEVKTVEETPAVAPITSAPIASAPITSAPIASAPITSAPVTSATPTAVIVATATPTLTATDLKATDSKYGPAITGTSTPTLFQPVAPTIDAKLTHQLEPDAIATIGLVGANMHFGDMTDYLKTLDDEDSWSFLYGFGELLMKMIKTNGESFIELNLYKLIAKAIVFQKEVFREKSPKIFHYLGLDQLKTNLTKEEELLYLAIKQIALITEMVKSDPHYGSCLLALTLDKQLDRIKSVNPGESLYVKPSDAVMNMMKALEIAHSDMMKALEIAHSDMKEAFPVQLIPVARGPKYTSEELQQFRNFARNIRIPNTLPPAVATLLESQQYYKAVKTVPKDQAKVLESYLLAIYTEYDRIDSELVKKKAAQNPDRMMIRI